MIHVANKRLNKYAAKMNIWKSQKLKMLQGMLKSSIEQEVAPLGNSEVSRDEMQV